MKVSEEGRGILESAQGQEEHEHARTEMMTLRGGVAGNRDDDEDEDDDNDDDDDDNDRAP